MIGTRTRVPRGMPVLSPGRHRHPRRGACLMEYVSVLAGERFSDKPHCTDPVLAAVARSVNDYSSDTARQRLAVVASELSAAGPVDLAVQQDVARRCLLSAIPVSSGQRRRVLLVGVLGLERATAGHRKGFSDDMLCLDTELALLSCTGDVDAARQQVAALAVRPRQQHRGLAIAIELAVATIAAESSTPDDDLYALLLGCLGDVTRSTTRAPAGSRRLNSSPGR